MKVGQMAGKLETLLEKIQRYQILSTFHWYRGILSVHGYNRKSEVIAECMDLDTVRWYEIQASPK
jgi:hypothetical protein